jgi:hypothetical protein
MPDRDIFDSSFELYGEKTFGEAIRDRWKALGKFYKIIFVSAFSILLLFAAQQLISSLLPAKIQQPNTSYSPGNSNDTSYAGTKALYQLLSDNGYNVSNILPAQFDKNSAILVINPIETSFTNSQANLFREALKSGARLVIADFQTDGFYASISGKSLLEKCHGLISENARPAAHNEYTNGVTTVSAYFECGYLNLPKNCQDLYDASLKVAIACKVYSGTVILIESTLPFENSSIAISDNAKFDFDVIGPPSSTAYFADQINEFQPTALNGSILTSRYFTAIYLAIAAYLIYAWSRSKRLGPAKIRNPNDIPARVTYINALAQALAKSREQNDLVLYMKQNASNLLLKTTRFGLQQKIPKTPSQFLEAIYNENPSKSDIKPLSEAISWYFRQISGKRAPQKESSVKQNDSSTIMGRIR